MNDEEMREKLKDIHENRRPWEVEGDGRDLVYRPGEYCGHYHLEMGIECRRPKYHEGPHANVTHSKNSEFRVEWGEVK